MPDSHETPTESADQTATATPQPARKKASIFRDPVVRGLSIFAAILVIFYLITVVSALTLGVLSPQEPRTSTERAVMFYEASVVQTPNDAALWKKYINALMAGKQYLKAQEVIDRAKKGVDQTKTQDITAAQAELYLATEKYDQAIKTADDARTKIKAAYDKGLEDPTSAESVGSGLPENYWILLFVKSEAQAEKGDVKGAIKTLDVYIKEKPTAADALVRRGLLKADVGDTKGAESDFRAALEFIPDDPAALAGLKKIGVEE